MTIPARKKDILQASHSEVDEIEQQYQDGNITKSEKRNKVIDVWTKATQDISKKMMREISHDKRIKVDSEGKVISEELDDSFNPIFMLSNS